MDNYEAEYCIRGYHVYKEIWEAPVGQVLECAREPLNPKDRYAVAVKRTGTIVGHLPRSISKVCSVFLRRGGVITCTVSGPRRYSSDLLQGGLEVPCILKFGAIPKEIAKLKQCLKHGTKGEDT